MPTRHLALHIELASMGASGYAGAWVETDGNVEPLVVAVERDGSISYRSVLVVRADMAAFHLALPAARPAIYEQIERGGGQGYRRVRHEDFQPFIDLRKEEATQRRQRS